MIGRLRQVLPGWSSIAVFAGLFLFLEGPVLYFEWNLGRRILDLRVRPGTAIIYVTAAFYGIQRATALHPFYNLEYRKWLAQTPWTVHRPLPLGPIALVLEDGLVLGPLILLTLTQPDHHSIRIVNIFLIFHSICLAGTFWPTGVGTFGYLVLFGLGLAVHLWPLPWACFAVAVSVYLVVHEGLWQSLARFPWQTNLAWSDAGNNKLMAEKIAGPSCGWPYDRFCRDIRTARRHRLGTLDAVLISMLIGWWLFCIPGLISDPRAKMIPGILVSMLTICLVPLMRLAVYVNFYWPPISFLGRIRTGRWIIPGYDQCFVGPVLAVIASGGVLGLCTEAGLPIELSAPLAVTTVFLVTLITPPGLEEWRLTGKHRIIEGRPAQGPQSEYARVG
jgi:hypothetical protein